MTVIQRSPPPELIAQLMSNYQKPEDLIGEHGLLKQLTQAVVERALQVELEVLLDMAKTIVSAILVATLGMAEAAKHSKVNLANCRLKFPEIVTVASSHESSPSIKHAGTALMTRYCHCMHAA